MFGLPTLDGHAALVAGMAARPDIDPVRAMAAGRLPGEAARGR